MNYSKTHRGASWKNISIFVLALAVVLTLTLAMTAQAKRGGEGGRGNGPIVYVTSQNLYYDSIVTADPLPPNGPFQELRAGGGPLGGDLNTDFGPGDRGYRGGRWVETFMTGEPHYFSCPLLGPGRESP